MSMKKLTDKDKVERVKREILRALREVKTNKNRAEVLGAVTMAMCYSYAILDADKDDANGIMFVAASVANEVQGVSAKPLFPDLGRQIELPRELVTNDKPKSENPKK